MDKRKLKYIFIFIFILTVLIYLPQNLQARYKTSEELEKIKIKIKPQFYITLDPNGGTIDNLDENYLIDNEEIKKIVTRNEEIGELPEPTSTKVFRGWYISEDSNEKIEAEDIYKYTEDITLYAKYNSSQILTSNGLTLAAEWVDDNSIEFTLVGTPTQALYIRLRENNISIKTSAGDLYEEEYALNPLFEQNDEVYIKYEYIEGNAADVEKTFTVKYRDTTQACIAINTAELIANHSKANFSMDGTITKTGVLGVDVSDLSMFIEKGAKFSGLKFRVTYGKI